VTTLYSFVENGDVLDTVVHKNTKLSHVTLFESLDSVHLQTIIYIWDDVRTTKLSNAFEKFTNVEGFKSRAADLISQGLK
jgi:hypothetical protein